eukprot:scaffold1808_cov158-Amphora_coffeaeformis.AAC.4
MFDSDLKIGSKSLARPPRCLGKYAEWYKYYLSCSAKLVNSSAPIFESSLSKNRPFFEHYYYLLVVLVVLWWFNNCSSLLLGSSLCASYWLVVLSLHIHPRPLSFYCSIAMKRTINMLHSLFIILCGFCSTSRRGVVVVLVVEGSTTAPLLRRRETEEGRPPNNHYVRLDTINFIQQRETTQVDEFKVWQNLLQESVGMSLTSTPTFSPQTTAAPTEDTSGATDPTQAPTTRAPTSSPTAAPSPRPTPSPTRVPTPPPAAPTRAPSPAPTAIPTSTPTRQPTDVPTVLPTATPTSQPTSSPTSAQTRQPTDVPTPSPTSIPTQTPEDCTANGVCNENCSELTPDPDCAAGPAPSPQCAPVVSDFENGDEGWTVLGDAQGGLVDPTYSSVDGNPGGYIFAVDDVSGGVWRFQAPSKFQGDFSAAYGLTLSFDLFQNATTDQFSSRDVIIQGGDSLIWYDTPNNPGTTWTSYSIPLTVEAGWQLNDNELATEDEIQTVLSSIEDIQIRGEFLSGPDRGGLDNVILEAFCVPTSAPTTPEAALFDVLLVDARDDSPIRPIVNGQIIELEFFSSDVEFSLLADADDTTTTAVRWVLRNAETGDLFFSFIDNSVPFTAGGEVGEDISPVSQLLVPGRYELQVTPINADGRDGESITRVFSIVESFQGGTGTNQGTEFWIVELPNLATLPVNDPGDFGIAVINTGAIDADVEIIHINSQAVETISVSAGGVQIVTYPRRGVGSSGVTTVPAYRVLSNEEIVVYAFTPLVDVRSNDAAIILPTSGLGTEYRVLGYESPTGNFVGTIYAAIATEDNTRVQAFDLDGNTVDDETLQAGQVLQRLEQFDLTGYRIVADKPVAVFTGSRCTAAGDSNEYCDILYEQVLPEQVVGSTYLGCPSLSRPIGCSDQSCAPDIFRYLATEDGTTVNYLDNTVSLSAGGFAEFETNEKHVISASSPIYVYQVLLSSGSSPNAPMIGDPALIAIPPVEQYQFDYVFYTPPTFANNFVNVMSPNGMSLTIDGAAETVDCTGDIAGTIDLVDYCCEAYEVQQGVHSIEGSEPFGIYATGFDQFASYGYTGGTGLQGISSACANGGPYRVTSCTTPVTATLNGSASCDSNATPLLFWSTPDAPVEIEDVTDPSTTVSVDAFGSFVVCLDIICGGTTTQCCSSINVMQIASDGGACP